MAVAAGAAIAMYTKSPGALGQAISVGFRGSSRSLRDGDERRERVIRQNELNARRRRELGLEYLERIAARTSPSADLLCKVARARFALGRLEESLAACEAALEVDSECEQAQWLSVYYLLRLNRSAEAVSSVPSAATQQSNIWLIFAVGDQLAELGRHDLALMTLQIITACDSSNAESWERQGHHYEKRGDFDQAALCYDNATTLDPNRPRPWEVSYRSGEVAFSEGKLEIALTLLARSSSFKPRWTDPLVKQAIIKIKQGAQEQALELLDKVLLVDSNHTQANFISGNIHHARGDAQRAREYWMRAFATDDKIPVPWVVEVNQARTSIRERKFADALTHLNLAKRWVESWPVVDDLISQVKTKEEARTRAAAGDELFQGGDLAAAVGSWEQSAEIDPSVPEVLLKIGAVYADSGNTSKAREFFLKAASLGHPKADDALRLCASYHEFIPEVGPT